jgi:hypothetical protein
VIPLVVTCTHGDTWVSIECEDDYSPDIADDLCRRASVTLLATVVQLIAVATVKASSA